MVKEDAKAGECPIFGCLAGFGIVGKMQKSIILLSLLLSLPAFGAGDVERAALVPQRVIPSGGSSSTTNTTSLRSISQRGGDGVTTGTTSVADRRASGARNAVSRETAIARTTTAGGSSVVRQRNVDESNQRSVAVRSGNSTVSGGSNVVRAGTTTATVMTASGTTGTRSSSSSLVGSVSVSQNTRMVNAENVAAVKSNFESLSGLKDTCKASYYQCMDNFCNGLSEEIGRCSCNKNVKNYEKTESALRAATQELQEVAQKIQYIGLTPNEITTLFTETEAETVLGRQVDNSKIKNDLERIRNMIVDVKSGSSSAAVTENSGISIDLSNLLSFNIDSSGFDITGLFGTTTQNTSSISNQRGEALYKSAAARCKSAVLNDCSAYGIDAATIVNSYDIEIDKDCMLYERKLTDENTAMLSTIRNAKTVLQKARLMVAQQKNQYDLRGCISALDSCMQDDFVCGTDYEECLDPTGKYIVEGKVVLGSMPGMALGTWGDSGNEAEASSGLYTVWNNNGGNIWSRSGDYTVAEYISDTMSLESAKSQTATDISTYLQKRMGWHDDASGRNYGMCVSILNKCQKQSYDEKGNYMGANTVISSWLESAFRKIKQSQDRVLMNYAQTCLGEVSTCLTQNNYGLYSTTTSSGSNPSDIAIKACLSVINTCRSVTMGLSDADVTPGNLSDIYVWLDAGIGTNYQSYCESTGGTWEPNTEATYDGSCSCAGDLVPATTTNNKYCVCATAGYVWSETDQACIDPNASSSSGGSGSGSGSSGSQSGGGNTQTNTTVTITLYANGGAGTIKTSSGTTTITSSQQTATFTCTAGASVSLPTWASSVSSNNQTNITKSSKRFLGWATSSSATSPGSNSITCPQRIGTYYAVWGSCSCTNCTSQITNNQCDGTCNSGYSNKECNAVSGCSCSSSGGVSPAINCNTGYVDVNGECQRIRSGAITLDSSRWTSSSTSYPANTAATPTPVYSEYQTGIYRDSNFSNAITALTRLPVMNGYVFQGFFVCKTGTCAKTVDENGNFTAASKVAVSENGGTDTWYAHWEADNSCGANQHMESNVCVCDTGYEMVYGVSGSNYHAGLYCVLPQVNQSSSFASAAPDMCYVSGGVGSSIQNGCGFSEGQEYPDSSNWKLEWSNNVAFGEAVCVGTEASDVFGTMYTGFGGQGTSCVCRISGQPFYVLAGSVGSTVSDCQTYCPSMCGCQASGDSHSGQCSAIDPGSFRARLYTAAP